MLHLLGACVYACAQNSLDPNQAELLESSSRSRNPVPASDSTTTSSSSSSTSSSSSSSRNFLADGVSTGAPAVALVTPQRDTGIDWGRLIGSSLTFLAVSHSFRYATEATTRRSFDQPYFEKYGGAVANLRGWGDGDPFIVNYVGHPMQGAVANYIWQHNDRAFRTIEFGRDRRYWKGRLRGMAFAYVYSVQFEIGPISEASLGHIQGMYPQIGFVDHVITPTVGMGWAIAEDAIDREIIQRLERHVSNPWLKMAFRTGMNPARTMGMAMNWEKPWHREDRPGVFKPFPENALWAAENKKRLESTPVNPPPGVAPFDFAFHATFMDYTNAGSGGACMGGGGTAGFRVADEWQILLDVGGCKMMNFNPDWTGDTLTYMVGPRWTPRTSGRWTPHLQALVGGTKITQEYQNPVLKAEVADWHPINDEGRTAKHDYFSTDWTRDGFALAAGAGVDYRFNNALALRLANLEYAHQWVSDMNGMNYRNAVQVSGGLILRMGTW